MDAYVVNSDTLVSVGLPVRNAGTRVADVVRSVLAQDHERMELVISDNASTDDTEEVCRDLAKSDPRIAYHRQAENIGLLNNFEYAIRAARGTFFRWIGDDDELESTFVSRCLGEFAADSRLLLVTTGLSYSGPDGAIDSARYDGSGLGSDDPVVRLVEMLRLLNQSHLLIDPLYGWSGASPSPPSPDATWSGRTRCSPRSSRWPGRGATYPRCSPTATGGTNGPVRSPFASASPPGSRASPTRFSAGNC
jgi:Glycosyltransferases involved in cell wall biogenesis